MDPEKEETKQTPDNNLENALNTIINAIYLGQTRGAWKLEEAEVLNRAIKIIKESASKKE